MDTSLLRCLAIPWSRQVDPWWLVSSNPLLLEVQIHGYRSYHSKSRCKCTYFSFVKMNGRIQHRVIANIPRNRRRRRWSRGNRWYRQGRNHVFVHKLVMFGQDRRLFGLGLGRCGWSRQGATRAHMKAQLILGDILDTSEFFWRHNYMEEANETKGGGRNGCEEVR